MREKYAYNDITACCGPLVCGINGRYRKSGLLRSLGLGNYLGKLIMSALLLLIAFLTGMDMARLPVDFELPPEAMALDDAGSGRLSDKNLIR